MTPPTPPPVPFVLFYTLVAVVLSIMTSAPTPDPSSINWLAVFFAATTFYSEILAAVPSIKSNAIYQQIGVFVTTVAKILRVL